MPHGIGEVVFQPVCHGLEGFARAAKRGRRRADARTPGAGRTLHTERDAGWPIRQWPASLLSWYGMIILQRGCPSDRSGLGQRGCGPQPPIYWGCGPLPPFRAGAIPRIWGLCRECRTGTGRPPADH
jgi:hypothetical protein